MGRLDRKNRNVSIMYIVISTLISCSVVPVVLSTSNFYCTVVLELYRTGTGTIKIFSLRTRIRTGAIKLFFSELEPQLKL